jgi:hypothetical protein
MRWATNKVTQALENYLTFSFDAPPQAMDLEGISGPGDSGGPALIEVDGKTFVVGVSSANDDRGAAGPCRYGSTEYYARVSAVAGWIEKTMASGAPRLESAGDVVELETHPWPDSPAGRIAAAFFAAYAQGGDQAMATFEQSYRAESALRERPLPERIESWRGFQSEWGELRPLKYLSDPASGLHVLVRAEGEGVYKSFRFEIEPGEPHKLTGIAIASPVGGE